MKKKRNALGIDIADNEVCMALVEMQGAELRLVKMIREPVPEGIIVDHEIERPDELKRAIGRIVRRNRIYTDQAAISIFVRPQILQIFEMPQVLPANIRQYVQGELKRCVAIANTEISFDFCPLGHLKKGDHQRILVSAVQREKLIAGTRAVNSLSMNLSLVEPAILAYRDAFYTKRICGHYNDHVVFAIVNDEMLTLAVFKDQQLNFVRIREIEKDARASIDAQHRWLSQQIRTVIEFYDMEADTLKGKWNVHVYDERSRAGEFDPQDLQALCRCSSLTVLNKHEMYKDTDIEISPDDANNFSAVAVGLALSMLRCGKNGFEMNLLPTEAAEIKTMKVDAAIAMNAAAIITLLIILGIGALSFKINKTRAQFNAMDYSKMSQAVNQLRQEQSQLEAKIESFKARRDYARNIFAGTVEYDWSSLLNQVGAAIPAMVSIREMENDSGGMLRIEGEAISYEAIHQFVKKLQTLNCFESASLVEAQKETPDSYLVFYEIECVLALDREKNDGT